MHWYFIPILIESLLNQAKLLWHCRWIWVPWRSGRDDDNPQWKPCQGSEMGNGSSDYYFSQMPFIASSRWQVILLAEFKISPAKHKAVPNMSYKERSFWWMLLLMDLSWWTSSLSGKIGAAPMIRYEILHVCTWSQLSGDKGRPNVQ